MTQSETPGEKIASPGTGQLYKWVCPVCETSNIGSAEKNGPIAGGLHALQSHIRAKAGDGHGPQYVLSERWTERKLRQYVEISNS